MDCTIPTLIYALTTLVGILADNSASVSQLALRNTHAVCTPCSCPSPENPGACYRFLATQEEEAAQEEKERHAKIQEAREILKACEGEIALPPVRSVEKNGPCVSDEQNICVSDLDFIQ